MRRERGFGAVAAIVVLVILGGLSAAIVSIGTTQQTTSAQDILSTRAWQAAKAGNDYGLYAVLQSAGSWSPNKPSDPCLAGTTLGQGVDASTTLDLTSDTGFHVTVTATCWRYSEGETTPGVARHVRLYRIKAVACPAASCPASGAAVASPGYIERSRVVIATD